MIELIPFWQLIKWVYVGLFSFFFFLGHQYFNRMSYKKQDHQRKEYPAMQNESDAHKSQVTQVLKCVMVSWLCVTSLVWWKCFCSCVHIITFYDAFFFFFIHIFIQNWSLKWTFHRAMVCVCLMNKMAFIPEEQRRGTCTSRMGICALLVALMSFHMLLWVIWTCILDLFREPFLFTKCYFINGWYGSTKGWHNICFSPFRVMGKTFCFVVCTKNNLWLLWQYFFSVNISYIYNRTG